MDAMKQFFVNAGQGDTDALTQALEDGSVTDVNATVGKREETALMSAAMGEFNFRDQDPTRVQQCIKAIQILVKAGAELEATDKQGDTALIKCAAFGCKSSVSALVKAGANINFRGNQEHTALIWASRNGHTSTVELLIQLGADIEALDGTHDYSSLIYTAIMGHKETMQLLLESRADVNRQGSDGFNALIWASRKGFHTSAKLLIHRGANVNAANADANTALHGAAGKGFDETVGLLVRSNADINEPGKGGQTPLIHAARKDHPDTVSLLMELGADVSIVDDLNMTPMDHAKEKDLDNVIMTLSGQDLAQSKGRNGHPHFVKAGAVDQDDNVIIQGQLSKKKKNTPGFVTRFYRLTKTGALMSFKDMNFTMLSKQYTVTGRAESNNTVLTRKSSSALSSPRSSRFAFTFIYGSDKSDEMVLYANEADERTLWINSMNGILNKSLQKPSFRSKDSFWGGHKQDIEDDIPMQFSQLFEKEKDVFKETIEITFEPGPLGIRFIIENDKVVISQVYEGQACDKGVLLGDVVTKVNGEGFPVPEETSDFEEFFGAFQRPVSVTLERIGRVKQFSFTQAPLGIDVIVEGFIIRVLNARKGFTAHDMGLRTDDLIVMVNDMPFECPEDSDQFARMISEHGLPIKITIKSFEAVGETPRKRPPVPSHAINGTNSTFGTTTTTPAVVEEQTAEPEAPQVPNTPNSEPEPVPEPDPEPEAEAAAAPAETGVVVQTHEPLVTSDTVQYAYTITDKATGEVTRVVQRYSIFSQFRSELISHYRKVDGVPFPAKTFFKSGGRDLDVIATRATMLQAWLNTVLNNAEIKQSGEVMEFLRVSHNNAQAVAPSLAA